jgi:hypothetical protein
VRQFIDTKETIRDDSVDLARAKHEPFQRRGTKKKQRFSGFLSDDVRLTGPWCHAYDKNVAVVMIDGQAARHHPSPRLGCGTVLRTA